MRLGSRGPGNLGDGKPCRPDRGIGATSLRATQIIARMRRVGNPLQAAAVCTRRPVFASTLATSPLICCRSCRAGCMARSRRVAAGRELVVAGDQTPGGCFGQSGPAACTYRGENAAFIRNVRMLKEIDKSVSPRHSLVTVPSDVARQTDHSPSSHHQREILNGCKEKIQQEDRREKETRRKT